MGDDQKDFTLGKLIEYHNKGQVDILKTRKNIINDSNTI